MKTKENCIRSTEMSVYITAHISKILRYCLTLHNSNCVQPNKNSNNKKTRMYMHLYDNTFKIKKNEEVCVIKY